MLLWQLTANNAEGQVVPARVANTRSPPRPAAKANLKKGELIYFRYNCTDLVSSWLQNEVIREAWAVSKDGQEGGRLGVHELRKARTTPPAGRQCP